VSDSCQPPRLKPAFIIIGAQRAGTTSLYSYLTAHPLIAPAATKEVHFFDVHYGRGTDWYWEQFPVASEAGMITGEASPYYLFHPLVPERIAALLPEVKLIVLLRNPIDRALSHHQHESRRGKEVRPFTDAVAVQTERLRSEAERIAREPGYRSTVHQWHSYRCRGRYLEQIEQWLPHFPRRNFLPLLSERFYADPSTSLRQVTDFLQLPPMPPKRIVNYEKHNRASYPGMPSAVRQELAEYYRPHNSRLATFLGEDPGWDS